MVSFNKPLDFPVSPTGTTGIQKEFAIQIRKVFKRRLKEIFRYLQSQRQPLKERRGIRFKNASNQRSVSVISSIIDKMKFELSPIVLKYIKTSFLKGNLDVAKITGLGTFIPFDQRVLTALQNDSFFYLNKFTTSQNKKLRDILVKGIQRGDRISTIANSIRDSFKISSYKSELIARSEVIKTYAKSTRQAIINGGVTKEYIWKTSRKENVCPICRPLHNQLFDVMDPKSPMPVEDTHPQCFIDPQIPILTIEGYKSIGKLNIGDLVLTKEGKYRKITRLYFNKQYKGSVITLSWKKYKSYSNKITITPEHPVMTLNGYKKANDLKIDDKIMVISKKCLNCKKEIIDLYKTPDFCNKSCTESYSGNFDKKKQILKNLLMNHDKEYTFMFVNLEKIERKELKRKRRLYNIEVDEFNNYIAKGIVFHNCNCGIRPYVRINQ